MTMVPIATASLMGLVTAVTSTLLPGPGVHDWLVPGARWRLDLPTETLTFDDGPDSERTPRILDALAKWGIRATFFVVGQRARRESALIRRMAAEGHQLGNHGWDHASLLLMSRSRIRDQLRRSQETIESIVGAPPLFVRPPFGRRDYRFYQVARELGLTTLMWSLDSGDWLGLGSASVAKRVGRARPGDIVLFHDGNTRASGLEGALSLILPNLDDKLRRPSSVRPVTTRDTRRP